MAYNVKFLKGTLDQYNAVASKDTNTFYYVDEADLYLGSLKLSNGADLAAAILRIAETEADIARIDEEIGALVGTEGGSSISSMIEDAVKAAKTELRTEIKAADDKAVAAQAEVDALETKVAADEALIQANTDAIDAIEADYLKAADKEELAASIKAISDDYLTSEDKTELEGKIKVNTDAIDVLNGDETVEGSVDKKVADAINEFSTAMTDNGTVDTFKEIVNYISTHGGEAAEMASAISSLETKVGDKSVAIQISEAIDAENLSQYATDEELAGVSTRVTTAEGKIAELEGKIGTTNVADQISTAKEEAIEAAAEDATTKANAAEANAKEYANSLAGNYATAAQGAKADTALQANDITTGSANGTIAVKGTDVAVKGLGSAAYAATTDFDAAGSAEAALTSAKSYTDTALTWGTIA